MGMFSPSILLCLTLTIFAVLTCSAFFGVGVSFTKMANVDNFSSIEAHSENKGQNTLKLPPKLHTFMDPNELNRIFGVKNASKVGNYEVIQILRHRNLGMTKEQLQSENFGFRDKRSTVENNQGVRYSFFANGKTYDLTLMPNSFLFAPHAKSVAIKSGPNGEEIKEEVFTSERNCHFLDAEGDVTVAISHCTRGEINGYIIDDGTAFEISPLSHRLRKRFARSSNNDATIELVGPHIIRPIHQKHNTTNICRFTRKKLDFWNWLWNSLTGRFGQRSVTDGKVLELAIFVDKTAFDLVYPYVCSIKKMNQWFANLINVMQAYFHHPSLGQRINLTVVLAEYHYKTLPFYNSTSENDEEIMEKFCKYQMSKNKPSDSHPFHWDMALLFTGRKIKQTKTNGNASLKNILGLSYVNGICTMDRNCGAIQIDVGGEAPTTFSDMINVGVQQIGHNLGLSPDGDQESCPDRGFIMGPFHSGVNLPRMWSPCSANKLANARIDCMNDIFIGNEYFFQHGKYFGESLKTATADEQCQMFLKNKCARAVGDMNSLCHSMHCQEPNNSNPYLAGPALPWTVCGEGKWCINGRCILRDENSISRMTQEQLRRP